MGTRADFYVGTDKNAEWLGSIAWDGYPDGIDGSVLGAGDEQEFRATVAAFLAGRRDKTLPADGWPWPWNTSHTTDYSYAFAGGKVMASCFGGPLYSPERDLEDVERDEDEGPRPDWPDMSKVQNVSFGANSGLIVVGGGA